MDNFTTPAGIPSYEEVKQMENILSAFDGFDDEIVNKAPQQKHFQQKNPQKQNILESHYDSAFDFGDVPEEMETEYYTPSPTKQNKPKIIQDVSFIINDDARQSVEKYLNRNIDLYSKEIQEIICMDEKLQSMLKDANDIKQRHKRCKELNLTDAGKVFARQYKEIGAEIKILELRLKNLNKTINHF